MSRTAIAKLVTKEFEGVNLQEAFRLVNNCIRDRVLVAVQHPDLRWDKNRKPENRRKQLSLRYIVLRHETDIVNKDRKEKDRLNEEYGLTDEDWEVPLDEGWNV